MKLKFYIYISYRGYPI